MHKIGNKKMLIFTMMIMNFYVIINSQTDWTVDSIKEIQYSEIDNFLGIDYSDISLLNSNTITFYYDYQHYLFKLDNLLVTRFGTKGNGPGEFQKASNLIEINSKRYCVDEEKKSLMIFDFDNNLLTENRLDFIPLSIFNIDDREIGITKVPLKENDKLINSYSLQGEFLYQQLNVINQVSKYKSYPELSFLYSKTYSRINKNKMYIFFNWVPYFIQYDLSDNSSNIIDYHKKLSFKPEPPIIDIKNGNFFTAGLFYNEMIGSNENFWIFRSSNRKSLKDKESKKYFFMINKTNFDLEMINILNKETNLLLEDNLFVYNDNLYVFNDEKEKIYVYKIYIEEHK